MPERVIHILPEQVASQIAAGEVVERPASAIKELVENSLDADARSIAIEIRRGGLDLIAVSDDGCGMGREDAILSLRRHATSKIRDASDLEAIRTLGFRGEALASIASVSNLTLRTRRAGDAQGIELVANGGNLESERACAIAPGTQIEAANLFFNTPARLKFIKSTTAEQSAIAEIVQRLALANISVAFSLRADGRDVLNFARATSELERVRQVWSPKLASKMLAFSAARAGLSVHGLATMSQESFASSRTIVTYVNQRAVRDKLLLRAIAQAYQTLLPRGRYPAVVMFVEMRHSEVDVNVHPMKSEVRFRDSNAIFDVVYHSLRERLSNQTSLASDPAGFAADPTTVARTETAISAPIAIVASHAVVEIASSVAEVRESLPLARHDIRPERPLRLVADTSAVRAEQKPLGFGFSRPVEASIPSAGVPMYSRLRVLGQIFAGYIALESDDGMILVDQHAAHERVTFERLRAELRAGGIRTQALLTPITIELNPARAAQIETAMPELAAMGFDVERFGPSTIVLKGTPAVFGPENAARLLAEMIESMHEARGGAVMFEDWLKQLACHGSVRVGRILDAREIEDLLRELDKTEFKSNCPHGRPVHIQFARGQIERMFRR